MSVDFQSFDYGRLLGARPDIPELGAREITRFEGVLANDNADDGVSRAGPRRSGFRLPAVAFVSGITAAAVAIVAERLIALAI